jgi:hypothetical protein
MNISFFMGTQIEILLTLLPYHRYDKLQMVFHLREYHFLAKAMMVGITISVFY